MVEGQTPLHKNPPSRFPATKVVHLCDDKKYYIGDITLDWTDKDPITGEWLLPENTTEAELPSSIGEDEVCRLDGDVFKKEAKPSSTSTAFMPKTYDAKEILAIEKKNSSGVKTLAVPGGEIWIA